MTYELDKTDRLLKLEEAQECIENAIELIRDAVRGTDEEANAEAYILAHLQNWARGVNPYDQTLPKIHESIAIGCMDRFSGRK